MDRQDWMFHAHIHTSTFKSARAARVSHLFRFASQKVIHRLQRLVLQELQVVSATFLQPSHKGGVPLLQAVLHVVKQQPASALLVGGNCCQWLLLEELELAVWE